MMTINPVECMIIKKKRGRQAETEKQPPQGYLTCRRHLKANAQ